MQPGGPALHAGVLADRAGSWPRLGLPADFADQIDVPVLSLSWPMQPAAHRMLCPAGEQNSWASEGTFPGHSQTPSSPMSLAENPL